MQIMAVSSEAIALKGRGIQCNLRKITLNIFFPKSDQVVGQAATSFKTHRFTKAYPSVAHRLEGRTCVVSRSRPYSSD